MRTILGAASPRPSLLARRLRRRRRRRPPTPGDGASRATEVARRRRRGDRRRAGRPRVLPDRRCTSHRAATSTTGCAPRPAGCTTPVLVELRLLRRAGASTRTSCTSLEHGAVWLAYAPDLADADVEVIHELRATERRRCWRLPTRAWTAGEAVVATAWARQLRSTRWTTRASRSSSRSTRTVDQAPEAGATC